MRYLLTASILSLVLVLSGCSNDKQIPVLPGTDTTSTVITTTVVNSDLVATTSSKALTPLKDQPVETWPRYEFKELGFSIQLPFQKNQITSTFEIETSPGCLLATRNITAAIKTESGNKNFLGSFERYRCFPHEGIEYQQPITELYDFNVKNTGLLELHFTSLTSTPEVGVVWPDDLTWSTPIEKKITVEGFDIYAFNSYYYYQTDENNKQNYPEQTAVFKLKNSPFRAVIIEFRKKDLSPTEFNSILTSIKHL